MSEKKFRASRIIIFDSQKGKTPIKPTMDRHISRTPSPESVLLVKSKLDLFSSFKDSFLNKSRTKSKFLAPLPANRTPIPKLNITNLNMKNYGLGDNRAQLISTAIKSMERLQSINLKGTGMKDLGASCILHSLNSENLRVIDMSSNILGAFGINSLCDLLNNSSSNLEILNLENVKISLKSLGSICSVLKNNRTLKVLNLANNAIGVGGGNALADMFDYNNTIETLDLQWNFIRGLDLILLSQILKNNTGIRTLDLSWNSIGHDRIHDSAMKVFQNLFSSESLQHLDLSNNNFSINDTKTIANLLKTNHRVQVHYEGNYGKIDSLGFLETISYLHIKKSGKGGVRICSKLVKCLENCWICNEWGDVGVEWDPQRVVWNRRLQHFALNKLSTQIEPVYIHFEIDDFKPYLLHQSSQVYFGKRTLPQGKNRFFFTYRGVAQISNEYPFEVSDPPIKQFCHFYSDFSKEVMAVVVNYIINDETSAKCEVRPELKEYIPPPGDVPEPDFPPWSIQTSVFANFSQTGPEIFNKCFETDWNNSKVSRFLKSDTIKHQCKELIRKEYQKMYEIFRYLTYKYLAGLSSNNGLFSVSLNTLTDLYQKKGVLDKNFKLSDLDLNIKACTTASTSTQFNNTFSVVRHEFLELQIRIGLDKYLRTGICKTEKDALENFFNSAIFNFIDPYEWRVQRLFNEECDTVITANKDLLNNIFENSKGKVSKNSEKRGLCEEDFLYLMTENGFFNDKFTVRYGHICFHLSLTTRVDEINNNAFMLAGFYEFVEAFCRIIDMTDSQDVDKDILFGFCNPEVPLDKKIEKGFAGFNYLRGRRGRR